MKKILLAILSLVLCLSLFACGESKQTIQSAEFGVPVIDGSFEITVNKDILTGTWLNGDADQYEEFLTTDMTNYGDIVPCDVILAAKDGDIIMVVSYSLKNIDKDAAIFKNVVTLNYNDGYTYIADEQYCTSGDFRDDWKKFTNGDLTSLEVKPLSSVECKASLTIPEEVWTNESAPLKLIIGNYEYKIR